MYATPKLNNILWVLVNAVCSVGPTVRLGHLVKREREREMPEAKFGQPASFPNSSTCSSMRWLVSWVVVDEKTCF